MEQFQRTISLIGQDKFDKLSKSKILIAGLGGVGSYVTEAISRSGVNNITIIDCDTVDITNINRQLYALNSTIGQEKTSVAKNRILDINKNCLVNALNIRIDQDTINVIDFTNVNYIIDCIDDVKAKLLLIEKAKELNIPIICSMGTAKKMDPTKFQIADIEKTSVCPLAKSIRYELRKRGIKHVKVLFSTEVPKDINPLGTLSTIPSIAGLLIANEVIKDIIKD